MSYGSARGDREGGSVAPAVLIGLIVVMIGVAVVGVAVHESKKSSTSALPSRTTVPAVTTTVAGPPSPAAPSATTVAPPSTVAPSATTVVPGGTPSTIAPGVTQLPVTGSTATTTTVAGSGRLPGAGPGSLSKTGGSPTEIPALALLAAGLLVLALVARASKSPGQPR